VPPLNAQPVRLLFKKYLDDIKLFIDILKITEHLKLYNLFKKFKEIVRKALCLI